MGEIVWVDGLTAAKEQAAEEGKLLLTYIFAPG